jgi:hypothetical protein
MNQLIALARLIRDLLGHDEQLIKIGRTEEERLDFAENYIVIDSLAPATATSTSEKYNDVAEELTYTAQMRQIVTIEFFGNNASANAVKFMLMLKSDLACDLQVANQITVHHVTQTIDLKALTGQQYGNRVQSELVIFYTQSLTMPVLRIDEAQFNFLKD